MEFASAIAGAAQGLNDTLQYHADFPQLNTSVSILKHHSIDALMMS